MVFKIKKHHSLKACHIFSHLSVARCVPWCFPSVRSPHLCVYGVSLSSAPPENQHNVHMFCTSPSPVVDVWITTIQYSLVEVNSEHVAKMFLYGFCSVDQLQRVGACVRTLLCSVCRCRLFLSSLSCCCLIFSASSSICFFWASRILCRQTHTTQKTSWASQHQVSLISTYTVTASSSWPSLSPYDHYT